MTEMDPVTPGGYVTTQAVRAFTGLPLDRVSDADLERAIQLGDSQINLLTGRVWTEVFYSDELLDGTGYPNFKLNHYPVIEVTKLEVYVNDAWTELDEWDPVLRTGNWRIKKARSAILEWVDYSVARGRDKIRVTYTAGYEEVPGYIMDLSTKMAAIFAYQQDAGQVNPSGFQSITEGALNVSYGSGAHDGMIKTLMQEVDTLLKWIGGKLDYAWSH